MSGLRTPTAPAAPSGAAGSRRNGGGRPRRRISARLFPYLLLIPAVLAELLVHIIPMVTGVWVSLRELTQFFIRNWSQAPFAGLANYRVAVDFSAPVGNALLHSFLITAAVSALAVAGAWLLGTLAALSLSGPTFRGRGTLRSLFLVPYALPMFTAVMTWSFMLQHSTGMVNHVLVDDLHLFSKAPFWLVGGNSFWSLLIVMVWRTWPFAFLTLTAGLQSIPGDLYEAAAIDGAGPFQRFRAVTLPMLRPVNGVLVLVLFLWSFNDFTTPYVLFGATAPAQADLISLHIYNASFITWNFGLGSAMSVLMLVFLLVVTLIYLGLTRIGSSGREGGGRRA
ncbi:carbohydrate ABC transporter permease [Phaeacidiphilus oryzae]|uniref:carbohydrate ABC transporter permease n=1 Tax=Phaeacidiphilus oryzae TaxID=348818 RepID=UPI001F26C5E6|nr:sugar ABC transporter permease [Phaeacidiphilus oryzae]